MSAQTGAIAWQHWAREKGCQLSQPVPLSHSVCFVEKAARRGKERTYCMRSASDSRLRKYLGRVAGADACKIWSREYSADTGKLLPALYLVHDASTGKQLAEFTTEIEYQKWVIRDGVFYRLDRGNIRC